MNERKQEVVNRLCSIVSTIGKEHFKSKEAFDCICHKNLSMIPKVENFQFSESILDFVEEAVKEKMKREIL